MFLIGALMLAVLGSFLVRLVTRPRTRPMNPSEIHQALRNLSRHQPRRVHGPDGIRLIGRDNPTDESTPDSS